MIEIIKGTIQNLKKIAGVAPQFDDTDKLAVSLYGKDSAAGDKEVLLDSNGRTPIVVAGTVDTDGQVSINGIAREAQVAARGLASPVFIFNETSWDRRRGNTEVTLLASAARTAETNSADQTNYNGRGLLIYVDWTVETDTVTLTPKLQVKDSIGSGYFTVWTAAAALTAIGDAVYLFYPGIVAAAAGSYTEAVNLLVGRTWRFQMGVADTDEATYSVSAVVLV